MVISYFADFRQKTKTLFFNCCYTILSIDSNGTVHLCPTASKRPPEKRLATEQTTAETINGTFRPNGSNIYDRQPSFPCNLYIVAPVIYCINRWKFMLRTDEGSAGTHHVTPLSKCMNEKCLGCGRCAASCPLEAVTHAAKESPRENRRKAELDMERYLGCGLCVRACRSGAIELESSRGKGAHPRKHGPPACNDGN